MYLSCGVACLVISRVTCRVTCLVTVLMTLSRDLPRDLSRDLSRDLPRDLPSPRDQFLLANLRRKGPPVFNVGGWHMYDDLKMPGKWGSLSPSLFLSLSADKMPGIWGSLI